MENDKILQSVIRSIDSSNMNQKNKAEFINQMVKIKLDIDDLENINGGTGESYNTRTIGYNKDSHDKYLNIMNSGNTYNLNFSPDVLVLAEKGNAFAQRIVVAVIGFWEKGQMKV